MGIRFFEYFDLKITKIVTEIETYFRFRKVIGFEIETIKFRPIDPVLIKYLISISVAIGMSTNVVY